MPQNQVQPTIVFLLKNVLYQVRNMAMLYYSSFLCVLHFNVVFLLCRLFPLYLYLSVNSYYYKTCHGTFLSQIHVFSFDVTFVILIGFCLILLIVRFCMCYISMLCRRCLFNAFPSVLVCNPDLFFLSIYEF